MGPGCTDGAAGCIGGATGCVEGPGDCTGGATGSAGATGGSCGEGGPPSAISIYVLSRNVYMTGKRLSNPIPTLTNLIMMDSLISYMKLIYFCPYEALNNHR